jgi:hypothetical protein
MLILKVNVMLLIGALEQIQMVIFVFFHAIASFNIKGCRPGELLRSRLPVILGIKSEHFKCFPSDFTTPKAKTQIQTPKKSPHPPRVCPLAEPPEARNTVTLSQAPENFFQLFWSFFSNLFHFRPFARLGFLGGGCMGGCAGGCGRGCQGGCQGGCVSPPYCYIYSYSYL